jgi:serine/threonine protein kinase
VHEAGIVHRDLKPSNVMLRDAARVALIDFGLAREVSDYVNLTVAGEIRGTPYYMSPEQAEGEPADERSDLYSAGIILYELLTGEKPYRGRTALAILDQHVSAPLPELPPALARYQPVLGRLLAKAPAARYQRVAELRAALALAARQA